MYIYQRISFDGSNWLSKSINMESLFDESLYNNQTLPGKEVKFIHEPMKEDHDCYGYRFLQLVPSFIGKFLGNPWFKRWH